MDLIIRRFAASFILLSLVLAHYHSPYWLWFTGFFGFQVEQLHTCNPAVIVRLSCRSLNL
jgi:hypothetical protein